MKSHVFPETLEYVHKIRSASTITRTYQRTPPPKKNGQYCFSFSIFQTFLKLGRNKGLLGGTLLLAEEMIYEREKKIRGEQRTMPWLQLLNA